VVKLRSTCTGRVMHSSMGRCLGDEASGSHSPRLDPLNYENIVSQQANR
jgi:hypothetical protein